MAKSRWYRYPLYGLVRAGAGIASLFPRRALLLFAMALGELGYWIVGRQREKTVTQLRRAFRSEKSEPEIRRLARGVFRHFAVTAVEILKFKNLNAEKVRKFVDGTATLEVYRDLLQEGRGVISITAHLGNWELLAAYVCLHDLPGTVVARRIYFEPYNRWITSLRSAVKAQTLYRESASREVLKRLKANGIVGILPDQDIDSLRGVFINYFGRPAWTPVAPVKLAMATGAPILMSFMVRTSWDKYQFLNRGVLRPGADGDKSDEAVKRYTEIWMKEFEQVIQDYPEQWGWMHDRWKTQPECVKV